MLNYFKTRTKTVQFVDDTIQSLDNGSVLTMTIIRDIYGDYSVLSVTGELSAVTGEVVETPF